MVLSAFDCVKRLHDEELHDDLVLLGSFVIASFDRNSEYMSAAQKCQTLVYYANALFQLDQFKNSEQAFYRALQVRRALTKTTESKRDQVTLDTEAEIRFRLHKCLVKQEKYPEAVGVLESIKDRLRTPKIRAALARLHGAEERRTAALTQLPKNSSTSLDNYKKLMREVPFAVESLCGFLNSGGSSGELGNGALSTMSGCFDWAEGWVSAQECMVHRDFVTAAHYLRELQANSSIANNPRLMLDLGTVYQMAGERTKAIGQLQRAHSLDPYSMAHMDLYAALLAQERKTKDLESLATQLMMDNPGANESWIALGYLCRVQNKQPKALYFAHKACEGEGIRPPCQAMLLKGRVLIDMRKLNDASQHFHEALLSSRDCFELYEGLVQCNVEQQKMKEARLIARSCRDYLGHQAPRPLTLAASVLARDPSTVSEAQTMLEMAVKAAPYLLDAVYLLVDLYDKQGLYDKAISLLRSQTEIHVNSKLHRLLGDFLSKTNRPLEAVDNYRHAQTLDPNDATANSRMHTLDSLPGAFATPDVTAPATAAFTSQLSMAPRRNALPGHSTPFEDLDDDSF